MLLRQSARSSINVCASLKRKPSRSIGISVDSKRPAAAASICYDFASPFQVQKEFSFLVVSIIRLAGLQNERVESI